MPEYDTGVIDDEGLEKYHEQHIPGLHMICDMNGYGLKWKDVKSGMIVKIRGKRMNYDGWEYLYSSVKGK